MIDPGDRYPGSHGQEPTEAQLTLMNNLIEQDLEGVEFAPRWGLFFEDDSLHLMISRESQCVYTRNGIRKREVEHPTPIFATDLIRHFTDQTHIEANFRQFDSKTMGSQVNVRVTDDGVVNAYLGTSNALADLFGMMSEKIRAEATGNESMVDVSIGKAVAEFVKYVESLDWPNVASAQGTALLGLLLGIRENLREEGVGERLAEEEALQVAKHLLTTCSAKGELFSSVETDYTTTGHRISIEKDPFGTSYLGDNVTAHISISPKELDEGEDSLDVPTLYYMNDGRIIYSSFFLPDGPDGDNSKMTPEEYRYESTKNAEIRPATFDDLALALAAMQEPREGSSN